MILVRIVELEVPIVLTYFNEEIPFKNIFPENCEKVILEDKTSKDLKEFAYHIFTEGTQFVKWDSPKKTNSWICKKEKEAGEIECSPNKLHELEVKISLQNS